jgi:hypothetical protein
VASPGGASSDATVSTAAEAIGGAIPVFDALNLFSISSFWQNISVCGFEKGYTVK